MRNKNVGLRSLYTGSIRAIGDENSRQFEISFSSEEPYDRWFGPEILDHSSGSCDLSRLQEIGVVLYNHNRDDVIGKVTRAWIDAGRGCATIELDDDENSERICKKVRSGTLKGISVGYLVTNWESVEADKKSLDGRFTGPCEVAKRWMPYEVSIVSVPADATVGVGREFEQAAQTTAQPSQEEERSSKPALSIYESIITANKNF